MTKRILSGIVAAMMSCMITRLALADPPASQSAAAARLQLIQTIKDNAESHPLSRKGGFIHAMPITFRGTMFMSPPTTRVCCIPSNATKPPGN